MVLVHGLTGIASGLKIGLGHISGATQPDDVVQAYIGAYRSGDLVPGCPRILAFSDQHDPDHWRVEDLRRLVDAIAGYEAGAGRLVLYHGAIVANTDVQAAIGELYCVLWELRGGPQPSYAQTRDMERAVADLCESPGDARNLQEQLLSVAAR
ncbi:MAG: hypothetical protein AAGH83_06010 [Pseudomonadota bacterium]